MRRVVVHIDRLLLHDLREADRHAIADALRSELGRQLLNTADLGRSALSANLARLKSAAIRIEQGAAPARLGRMAGHAIAGSIIGASSRGSKP